VKHTFQFDLEQAITSWRAFLSGQESLDVADLDELENHLREDVDRWRAAGLSDEEAFRKALRRLGNVTDLAGSYDLVRGDRWLSRSGRRFELGLMWDRLRSYALIARRNITRSPGYAALNTLGLALGMAVALLTGLFIRQHLTYDANVPNTDSLYRVNYHSASSDGEVTIYSGGPYGRARLIRGKVASVTAVTEFAFGGEAQYVVDGTNMKLGGIFTADQEFLEVFGVDVVRGEEDGLLEKPGQIALTVSFAQTLFGDEDPIGKTITRFPETDYVVAGIISDPPENSTFPSDGIRSRPGGRDEIPVTWDGLSNTTVFVKSTNPTATEEALDSIVESQASDLYEKGTRLRLQPLRAVHLNPSIQWGGGGINPQYLLFLGIDGGLLLFIFFINYG